MSEEVTVLTDSQLNAALSLYASKKINLPSDIALNSNPNDYFRCTLRFRLLNIDENPLIKAFMTTKSNIALAEAIASSASYLDRISHLSGTDIGESKFTDLTGYYSKTGEGRPSAVGSGGTDGITQVHRAVPYPTADDGAVGGGSPDNHG